MSSTAAKTRAERPTADAMLAILRRHEPELRAAGVLSAAIFGSVARGEATEKSDVDVLVRLDDELKLGGFSYFGHLETLRERLEVLLGRPVDIATEPLKKPRFREEVMRDRVDAF